MCQVFSFIHRFWNLFSKDKGDGMIPFFIVFNHSFWEVHFCAHVYIANKLTCLRGQNRQRFFLFVVVTHFTSCVCLKPFVGFAMHKIEDITKRNYNPANRNTKRHWVFLGDQQIYFCESLRVCV